ncbi:MAG: O-antigen polymerase [Bacteroidota bacterium]
MNILHLILAALVLIVVLSWLRSGNDRLSPGRIFSVVWLISVGLADLKLSGFQSEWTLYGWVVVLLGPVSFLCGLYTVWILFLSHPVKSVAQIRWDLSNIRIEERGLFRIIVSLGILYSCAYVLEVILEGAVPLLAVRPDRARVEFGIFGLHLVVTTVSAILFLVAEYFAFAKDAPTRKKVLLGLLSMLIVVSFFLLLQRFALVIVLLMVIPLLYYTGRSIRPRHALILGSVLLVIFFFIQSLRVAQYVQNYLYVTSKMRFSVKYAFLTEPYMYIVMNLENLARAAERVERFSFGYFTSDFILALAGLKHWIAEYFRLLERPFLVSGYNTFPFSWTYYHDFGISGMVIISFVLGVVLGIIYHRLRVRVTPLRLVLYCIGFFCISISFFTNPLTSLASMANFALLIGIHIYMQSSGLIRTVGSNAA